MSQDQNDYEIFISYARMDNQPIGGHPRGWVTELKDHIVADHRQYSTAPLRIFFDTDEIADMDDWRCRILGALRQSKLLLICLSPNYFKSGPCRWEWDEYQARQHRRLVGSDSHATVYFVEVPGTAEQENARRLEAIMGKNFTDLRPWFPAGAAAIRETAVRDTLGCLGQSIWERLERARRALKVPGNVRGMTPYFVGRARELADLHRHAGLGKIGLITAVHGLGGQGKTELSIAYARGYADWYPLGIWSLPAEGRKELLPLIGELAFAAEFGYSPSDDERKDGDRLGRAVLMELQRRAAAWEQDNPGKTPAALLLLDNVSETDLLGSPQLSKLPKAAWLRIVATTRLDPRRVDPTGRGIGTVIVDSLDPDDALRLIADHLPDGRFANNQDEADAGQIVKELGGFTLAIEQVAVFLGLSAQTSAPIRPGEYLARLQSDGLPSTDALAEGDAAHQIEHQEKQLAPVLRSMLSGLPETGLTLLRYASLLPPDMVAWPWLRELTIATHPELAQTRPGHVDPWVHLRRQVEGLRFLTPGEREQTARMHRLIAAHLRAGSEDSFLERLRDHVANRCNSIQQTQSPPEEWELDACCSAVPHLLDFGDHRRLATQGTFLTEKVIPYRGLVPAKALLDVTHRVHRRLAEADPGNAGWQRDLSVSLNKLGNLAVAQGQLPEAQRLFGESLAISRRLAEADPGNAGWQRDLSVSLERLGDLAVAQGQLPEAQRLFGESLAIRRRLAEADPGNAGWQRDLSVSLNKLGDLAVAQGQLPEAQRLFDECHAILRRLAEADPGNAGWQRDLSVSLDQLGNLAVAQGQLPEAQRLFGESLAISRRLAEADPGNAGWQRDLSVSLNKLGDLAVAQGQLPVAQRLFGESLAIRRRLAEADPGNAGWQRDLSVSLDQLGNLAVAQGQLPEAQRLFGESLAISRRLAEADPGNAGWQRDLSVSLNKLGDLAVAQGQLPVAQRLFGESLAIRRRLAEADPGNAGWQRDLSVSLDKLGNLAVAQGQLPEAQRLFGESLAIRRRLAEADPGNAGWQRDLSVSLDKLGNLAVAQGQLPEAQRLFGESLAIRRRLAEANPGNAGWQRDLSVSLNNLGNLAVAQGQLPEAQRLFGECNAILRQLTEADLGNAGWQRDLSASLEKLGDLAVAQGQLPEAKRLFGESLAIRRRLAEADPGNAGWQRGLSVSLIKLGDLAVAQGQPPEARRLFGESLVIARRLADADPGNAGWQRDLSVSLNKLGDLAVAQGQLPEAQRLFGESLAISRRLAEADPGNAGWQRDLSVSLEKLGNLAVAQGQLPEAQRLFGESLAISRRLAEADPGNAGWQGDLSVSLIKLGDLTVAQGQLPEAQRLFGESLAISRRLAEADPGNAGWQRDVWVSHYRVAGVLENQADPRAAEHWRRARDMLAGMVTAGLHVTTDDLGTLEELARKVSG